MPQASPISAFVVGSIIGLGAGGIAVAVIAAFLGGKKLVSRRDPPWPGSGWLHHEVLRRDFVRVFERGECYAGSATCLLIIHCLASVGVERFLPFAPQRSVIDTYEALLPGRDV